MTKRKKKLLIIQSTLFFAAILIIFYIFNKSNLPKEDLKVKIIEKNNENTKIENTDQSNRFEDVTYSGLDTNNNRYILKSQIAEFETSKPEVIEMTNMKATFYFKDNTVLYVSSDKGIYNNKTNDMKFINNVKSEYEKNYLYSDNLDYLNTSNLLSVYGNVTGSGLNGDIEADKLNFDISKKTLDISMFDNKQVNVNLKK